MQCRYYNIRLNPHKCIFVVESGRLLGFIVANDGIRVDPLKVLQKGAYELIDYEGNRLARPRNGLYLKQYFA